jgi:molybdate transport system ATP-binding protein
MAYITIDTELKVGNDFTFLADLTIEDRVSGVFGPSGSGKTTFLQLLAGLRKADKGKIEINNTLCFNSLTNKNLPAHKRRVGYVFQEGRLFPHLSVAGNLKYAWKKEVHPQSYYHELVELLELKELLSYRPSRLSGGQKQLAAIGRALMSDARLLLLDEPFTALDPDLKKQIIAMLNKVIGHLDIPVIIVSHELRDLLMLTQNILLVKDGRVSPPQNYLELIRQKKLLELHNSISSYYNIFRGKVRKNHTMDGLTEVVLHEKNSPCILIESDEFRFHPDDEVIISLRGSDVAIALDEVRNISVRNQLPGKIETLYQHRNHLVCIVDCGIRIVTRITIESGRKLGLEPGKEVWCLFKSLAIESNF